VRTTWPWPALCLLAYAGSAQAALQLQSVDRSLTPAQAAATRQLLADAVQRLPAAWTDALDQSIDVEWRDDLPAQVHGRAKATAAAAERTLLGGWMARPHDAGIERSGHACGLRQSSANWRTSTSARHKVGFHAIRACSTLPAGRSARCGSACAPRTTPSAIAARTVTSWIAPPSSSQ
jgi:hypothetical protein